VNYHTGEWIESRGELTGPIYLYPNDVFTLPIFVKAGALIPQMFVDDQTMNIFGKRLDDTRHDESILRVYADQTPSEFTLYEDDGTTIAYQDGDVRTTLISQVQDVDSVSLSINPAQGSFTGEIEERDNFIHLYTNGLQVVDVMLNGQMLPQVENQTALDDVEIGWYDAGNGLVIARSGVMSVDLAKDFIFQVASISEH
jgi:alpha-glucosidase (family GH31 glycosyl hydrolase)